MNFYKENGNGGCVCGSVKAAHIEISQDLICPDIKAQQTPPRIILDIYLPEKTSSHNIRAIHYQIIELLFSSQDIVIISSCEHNNTPSVTVFHSTKDESLKELQTITNEQFIEGTS